MPFGIRQMAIECAYGYRYQADAMGNGWDALWNTHWDTFWDALEYKLGYALEKNAMPTRYARLPLERLVCNLPHGPAACHRNGRCRE